MMNTRSRASYSVAIEQIKELVTMQEVIDLYGFAPNRAGFISCPFHDGDSSASLKIYPEGRGWYCFGCGAGGDVIKFVQMLYKINFTQALTRLNYDFNLNLNYGKPTEAEIALAKKREKKALERKVTQEVCELIYKDKSLIYRGLWHRYKNDGITKHEKFRMEFLANWLERHLNLDFDPWGYPRDYIKKLWGDKYRI